MRTSNRRPSTPAPGRRPGPGGPGRSRPPRLDPSRPQQWFAQQLVLVLSGQRPVHALLGHAREPAYDELVRLAPGTPLRSAGTPALRRVGACRPAAGVIEAFARIAVDGRVQALAFRLERGAEGRWRCSAVELAPRPAGCR